MFEEDWKVNWDKFSSDVHVHRIKLQCFPNVELRYEGQFIFYDFALLV